jgi:hypothetical protein
MRFAVPIAACAMLVAASASAQTRIVDQYVRGTKRICVYENLRPRARPGHTLNDNRVAMEVGRGEPCPARYSAPRPTVAPVRRDRTR